MRAKQVRRVDRIGLEPPHLLGDNTLRGCNPLVGLGASLSSTRLSFGLPVRILLTSFDCLHGMKRFDEARLGKEVLVRVSPKSTYTSISSEKS